MESRDDLETVLKVDESHLSCLNFVLTCALIWLGCGSNETRHVLALMHFSSFRHGYPFQYRTMAPLEAISPRSRAGLTLLLRLNTDELVAIQLSNVSSLRSEC